MNTLPFHGAFRCLFLLLCLVPAVSADTVERPVDSPPHREPVPSRAEIDRRIKDLIAGKLLRSASGHFLIIGTNRVENMALSGWAEDVATRLGKALGIDVPFKSRSVDLIVRSGKEPAAGKVFVSESVVKGALVQRMILWNYAIVDVEDARRELCRLLLAGYLGATIRGNAAARPGDAGVRHAVPLWLAEGLAQYIDPNLRGPNMAEVIGRWQKGRLPSVVDFLKADGRASSVVAGDEPELDSGMSAALVNWLLAHPERRERVREALGRLDSGKAIDAQWLATCMTGGESAAKLEEAWDYWLLGRRRVVYAPGRATQDVISLLKAKLLLYPGNSGIPLTVDLGRVAGLGDLIKWRKEEWVPVFCRKKIRSLSLLAVGRGEDFGAVTARFCDFLDAVPGGASDEKLRVLLANAEKALAGLVASEKGE